MASPAKIEQILPDTLPEDFGDWDSENSQVISPARPGSFDPAPGFSAPKPPAQAPKPQAPVARKASVLSNTTSNMRTNADAQRSSATIKTSAMREADEVLLQSIQTNRATMGRQKPAGMKWMKVAAIPSALILVMLVPVTMFYRGKLPMLRHSVEVSTVAADTQPETTAVNPPTSITSNQKPAAATAYQSASTSPVTDRKEVTPPQVQSKMMHDQLNAPTRIPHDLKQKAADDAPSSINIGAVNLAGQGNNSAIGNIFRQPEASVNVEQPKTVSVSAGVAGGLLLEKTPPVYPQFAKTSHVSGTVVLKATISKTGVIKNLHVVSGPSLLTQAAVDAVRTWRYKPYKLNNDPVEIETTISVVFTLGG